MSIEMETALDLCKQTARKLANMVVEGQNKGKPVEDDRPRLIFPLKHKKNLRVSAHHAREYRVSEYEVNQLFCREIERRSIHYSIETPTKYLYSGLSAEEPLCHGKSQNKNGLPTNVRTTLYEPNLRRAWNIEFKAGNIDGIKKEILKLVCEPQYGIFFHLFESADGRTLPMVGNKYKDFLRYAKKQFEQLKSDGQLEEAELKPILWLPFILRPSRTIRTSFGAGANDRSLMLWYQGLDEEKLEGLLSRDPSSLGDWTYQWLPAGKEI